MRQSRDFDGTARRRRRRDICSSTRAGLFTTLTAYAGHRKSPSPRCRRFFAGRRGDAEFGITPVSRAQLPGTSRPRRRRRYSCWVNSRGRCGSANAATAADCVSPPLMLSAEISPDKEVTWVGQRIRERRRPSGPDSALPGQPPGHEGDFRQPAVSAIDRSSARCGRTRRSWRPWRRCCGWQLRRHDAADAGLNTQGFVYDPRARTAGNFWRRRFVRDADIRAGRPAGGGAGGNDPRASTTSAAGRRLTSLINDETGDTARLRPRGVIATTATRTANPGLKGDARSAVTLPGDAPAGRYFLRIEPESDRSSKPIPYQVTVVRGAVTSLWFPASPRPCSSCHRC